MSRSTARRSPRTLLETELFGHEKGAFTGASQRKSGKFELAHRGTLFLDEIGDLPLSLQPKILRALEEKTLRAGRRHDAAARRRRVVAATNRNLKAAVAARQYREDLYFRLSVFPIVIPPLRDRPSDIPTLARYFIDKLLPRSEQAAAGAVAGGGRRLCGPIPWPGNVRELQNCIERAAILTEGDTIHPRHLNLSFRGPSLAAPVDEDGGPWSKIDLSGYAGRGVAADAHRSGAPQDRAGVEGGGRQPRPRGRGPAGELQGLHRQAQTSNAVQRRNRRNR